MKLKMIKQQNNAIKFITVLLIITCSHAANHSKTKLYDLNKNKYISALEYADAQKIRTIFYENKEKLEFRFQNHKLTISPHSSFIQINDFFTK